MFIVLISFLSTYYSITSSFFGHDSYYEMGYCFYELPSESAKLSQLFRPYDKFIWSGLLLTLLAYSVMHRNPVLGLALFGFLLNQLVQNKLAIKFSVTLLIATVLTNAYLGVVTADLVTPLRPRLYDTYGDLYNNTDFR